MPNTPTPTLPRPDGLIFDLDGTLVDTVPSRIDGWLEALEDAGLAVTRAQLGPMIGMDGKRLARLIVEANGREAGSDEIEELDRAAGEEFDAHNRSPRPLPGVADVMAAIEELGLRWVIATSSRREQVAASVASLGLASEPEIVDGSTVENAKPAPDLILLAASRLGLEPARCWSIGDSTWDMRASVAAGVVPVAIMAGSAVREADLAEAGAAAVLPSLVELAAAVRAACGDSDGAGGSGEARASG